MRSGAHLQLEEVGDVVDEGVLKGLLEGFKQDQLLSHHLQLGGKNNVFWDLRGSADSHPSENQELRQKS